MRRELTKEEKEKILLKLKNIVEEERKKLYSKKDDEIDRAKIKNITQSIASFGAQPNRFIGMLTLTFGKNEFDRVLPEDDESSIIKKTLEMYNSVLYYFHKLKKELKKHGFSLIYLCALELQEDGNLHAHIYFSTPLKAFEILFNFYHFYGKKVIIERKTVKFNKKEVEVIPIGRAQLGIAEEFKHKLEKAGYNFKSHYNKRKRRFDWRCINLISYDEFFTGSWPTLYFYSKKELEKHYSKKIVAYLTEDYIKPIKQKAVGSQFVKHNTKIVYEEESEDLEWLKIQKQFIRKICGRLYTASRLPIHISLYQRMRTKIMKIYPQYRNMNTLVTDLLNGKAFYKRYILIPILIYS